MSGDYMEFPRGIASVCCDLISCASSLCKSVNRGIGGGWGAESCPMDIEHLFVSERNL